MSDLSDDARTLIAATRRGDDPRPADEDRVHRAVMLRIGVGAVAGAAAASVGRDAIAAGLAKAGWSSLLGSTALKLMAVLAVGGSVTAGGYLALREKPQPAPVHAPAVAEARATTESPARPAGTAEKPELDTTPSLAADDLPVATSLPAATPEPSPSSAAAHKTSSLRAEVAAVGSANRSLRDGNPEEALRILDGNAAMLQDGTLREESAVSRILALCQLGRRPEAAAEGRRFIQSFPNSPLIPRVRASCAFAPTGSSVP